MLIAVAQINPIVGDIDYNKEKIIEFIQKAVASKADLVVFPEAAIIGYPARDLLDRSDLILENLKALEDIAVYSKDIAVICGFVDRNFSKTGKKLMNAAAFIYEGKVKSRHYKSLLPDYDVFDEKRHFEPAKGVDLAEFNGHKLGITICEDLWVKSDHINNIYNFDPNAMLVKKGAEILINISASPFSSAKPLYRFNAIKNVACSNQVKLVYVNQVGGNDDLIFDGGSVVVDESGGILCQAKNFEEDLFLYDTSKTIESTFYNPEKEILSIYQALKLGLKDYVHKCKFKKVILGLSGGIDSALTCAIAVKALGKDNVVGVLMPGPYSSQGSIDDALELAKNLGIEYHLLPISAMFESTVKTIQPDQKTLLLDLAEENLQARLRANIIMTLSNRYGYLALTTGNKSESSVGYSTLYGDMCGGLGVISDIYKTQVYELAKYINKIENSPIPLNSILKPPSAELKPDQKDQDSLPDYELLDKILKDYIEWGYDVESLKSKYDFDTVMFVLRKVDASEFKRRQAAPGIKVSEKAFGSGRRLPIAQGFRWR